MKTRKFEVANRSLSITEARVLILELYCNSRMEMADILGNSIHTIDTHIRNICNRFGLTGKRDIYRFGNTHGFYANGYFQGENLFEGFARLPFPREDVA